jgi:amino acid permease
MKFLKSYREIVVPAGMLASLIIGAGIFSLPYVVSRSGLLFGFLYLVGFTVLMSLVHLFYSDVVISDKSDSRFVNQTRRYLGNQWSLIGAVAILGGATLVLAIYLILAADFMSFLSPGVSSSVSAILFWTIGGLAIAIGAKEIAGVSNLLTILMVLLSGTVAFFGLKTGGTSFQNLSLWPSREISLFLLPLGPFLFSLNGRAAIVSLKEYFDANRLDIRKMRKAIVLGTFLAGVVYLSFIIGIIGITAGFPGKDIVADLALLPLGIRPIIAILGIVAIFTSYIFLGLELKSILETDFHFNKRWAFAATVLPSLLLYLFGQHDFIGLIGVAGGVFISIESILVILMWEKIKSKKLFINKVIIAIFVVAAAYEILKRLG